MQLASELALAAAIVVAQPLVPAMALAALAARAVAALALAVDLLRQSVVPDAEQHLPYSQQQARP